MAEWQRRCEDTPVVTQDVALRFGLPPLQQHRGVRVPDGQDGRYCSPLARSNTGNLGDFTSMSRLASSQLLFPARD
ncbi:hypothetical protein EYF80_022128 [Liparis tanakae]|uniref:Uncharacterized protein n=1 Tax=Liparis tanakae TaxID=230148 RepID=A0A4Z2HRN7_9TELE|nr:hypothetical protein EYF80_022128 [Liparis tanakae]